MTSYQVALADNQTLGVRHVPPDAHWRWLALGWVDFKASWRYGVLIGLVPVLAAWIMVIGLWRLGMLGFIPAVCGAFALVGPILAIGCYDISRRLAAGETINLKAILWPRIASPGQAAVIGFVLMFILIVWARLASMIFALASSARQPAASLDFMTFALQTPEGLTMIAVGTVVGAGLAAIGYVVSVVSIPLAADRKTDAMTAMMVSVMAVSRSKGAMISFAFSIAILVGISLATGFLALIIVFPWLGHATWHGYKAVTEDIA
jgi:uncharacterized membrane protein